MRSEHLARASPHALPLLGLAIRAPHLQQGDVLLWNSLTIHGSLATQDPKHSRASVTCHAIPESHRFLQLQARIMKLDLMCANGVSVHCPKDLRRLTNRAIFYFETHHPQTFYWAKRTGSKWLFRLPYRPHARSSAWAARSSA